MARKKETRKTQNFQTMASQAADKYFAALVSEIPDDSGDANLIDDAAHMSIVIRKSSRGRHDSVSAALHAGYLLGVEIGRRLGPQPMKGGA